MSTWSGPFDYEQVVLVILFGESAARADKDEPKLSAGLERKRWSKV
jgi:hypothetical protein